MCQCTPSKRTPVCPSCPPEWRKRWDTSDKPKTSKEVDAETDRILNEWKQWLTRDDDPPMDETHADYPYRAAKVLVRFLSNRASMVPTSVQGAAWYLLGFTSDKKAKVR